MSRLYAVESLFTLTGANADHRLRVPASLVGRDCCVQFSTASLRVAAASIPAALMPNGFRNARKIWLPAGGNALVVAGQRQPMEVHLLAHAINSALGAIGNTVTLLPAHGKRQQADLKNLERCAMDTLVILGGNPVYNLNWTPTQSRRRWFAWAITKTKRRK